MIPDGAGPVVERTHTSSPEHRVPSAIRQGPSRWAPTSLVGQIRISTQSRDLEANTARPLFPRFPRRAGEASPRVCSYLRGPNSRRKTSFFRFARVLSSRARRSDNTGMRSSIASLFVAVASSAMASEPLTFERDIRPIFRAHCFDCHGATEEREGGLDLRLVRFLRRGGENGPAIVPGNSRESRLIGRIRRGEMPPGDAKVSAEEIAILERWVDAGAKTARPEPETIGPGVGVSAEERAFWSFQPIERRNPPGTPSEGLTAIDAWILHAMPAKVSFAPEADRPALLTRVSLDLTGLPPSFEEIQAFVDDRGEYAYERAVHRLLESPHFGERWARHWLDVAGYADSEGGSPRDAPRAWAYRYRDWVVRALNDDKPLDRFVLEQLAGDELAGQKYGDWTPAQIDLLTATGFLRMAADPTGSGANDPATRERVIADTLGILGTSLLGMSIACAQCHDHRYDPIPHSDYFSLRAVFDPALDRNSWKAPDARRVSLLTQDERAQSAAIENETQEIAAERSKKQSEYLKAAFDKEVEKLDTASRETIRAAFETPAANRSAEQKAIVASHPQLSIHPGVLYQFNPGAADELKKYDARIQALRAKKPAEQYLRALVEPAKHQPETRRLHRGDHRQPREVVRPAIPRVLVPPGGERSIPLEDASFPTSRRRVAFARWLMSDANPLTARVIANRVWSHLFGRGIVATPGDFGRLGARPTHPELLDELAHSLRSDGWSLKRLIHRIVTSSVYRQTSRPNGEHIALDPENRWYSRQSIRRLDAEALRDRVLAVSGSLDRQLYGPPVQVKEDAAGQFHLRSPRRSLYGQSRRSRPPSFLRAFDAPVMETNCVERSSSTVATQSLLLLNGDFLAAQAGVLEKRIRAEVLERGEKAFGEIEGFVEPHRPSKSSLAWSYGYGRPSESKGVESFQPFPYWHEGAQAQGSPRRPDSVVGWAQLSARGGHPANHLAVVRRWTAPRTGQIAATGTFGHPVSAGNGVRARIMHDARVHGEWIAHNKSVDTPVETISVQRGDAVDFVVDSRGGDGSDGFTWPVEVRYVDEPDDHVWRSAVDFGPPSGATPSVPALIAATWRAVYGRVATRDELASAVRHVNSQLELMTEDPSLVPAERNRQAQALVNFAHMLLASNEFLYVE